MIGKFIVVAVLICSVIVIESRQISIKSSISAFNTTEESVCDGADVGEFVPSPNSCTQYYFCHPSIDPVQMDCADGLFFSHEHQICVDPAESGCIEGLKCPEGENIVMAHPYLCDSYIICYGGVNHVRECANNLLYNRFTENCDFPERVDCLSCPPTDSNTLAFFPSTHSCDLGYICMDGDPRQIRCNEGLHWNNATNQCDLPENVNCELIPTTDATWSD